MLKRFCVSAQAIFLTVCIIFAAVPAVTALAEEDAVYVVAGSDFQAETDEIGCANTKDIIAAIKEAGFTDPVGFLFAGDYNNGSDDKTEEIQKLKDTVKQEFPGLEEEKMIFTQGNHDPASSKGLSQSGENDTNHYGVFVIHEDEYMQGSTDEAKVKSTVSKLEDYLKQKASSGYKKPVFVISHVPLHYSYRTKAGGDGVYAQYMLDVLNKYGETLNIIFMFGHNHSWTYDNYLGGSAIYLEKGDPIYICKTGDKDALPVQNTLNFTYMNSGYVGYANCLNNMLTMTVFEIKDDIVKIYRYSSNGIYPLKAAGEWASGFDETAAVYGGNEAYLDIRYDTPSYAGDTASDENVTVVSGGITELSVDKNTSPSVPEVQSAYAYYSITAKGVTDGKLTAVSITLDDSFDLSKPVFVRDTKTNQTRLFRAESGKVVFETESVSSYELTQTRSVPVSSHSLRVFTPAGEMVDGGEYLILTENTSGKAYALRHTEGNELSAAEICLKDGFDASYLVSFDPSVLWTFESAAEYGFSSNMGTLSNKSTGKYLVSADGSTLSAAEDAGEGYYAWRLSSGVYGIYTLETADAETRSYLKYDNGYYISESGETVTRVYAYSESVKQVTVNAYIDSVAGGVELNSVNGATGSKIYLLGNDGTDKSVNVTLSMLKTASGDSISADTEGVYNGLYVYYNGMVICGNYSLSVGRETQFPAPGTEESEVSDTSADVSEDEDVLSDVSVYRSPDESFSTEPPEDTGNNGVIIWSAAGGAVILIAAITAAVVIKKRK